MAQVSPDSRALLVRSLRKLQHHSRLTGRDVRWAARALQVSERTVWRWLNTEPADPAGRPGPRPYLLTEADRDALADWCGSAAAAWQAQQAAGVPLPALRTFQQAVRRQLSPAERAALVDGAEGRRRHAVYLRREASHRNQIWEADHKHLPVLVLAPKAQRPRTPWVTLFLDAYSRLVMGWAISLHPSSATSLTALRMGLVIDPERGPFGGVPTLLRWDNGLEFAATALTRAAAALGCVVSPTPPYTPHLKGKIERLHRTITQELLSGLPFYTDGPRAADRSLYGPMADPTGRAPGHGRHPRAGWDRQELCRRRGPRAPPSHPFLPGHLRELSHHPPGRQHPGQRRARRRPSGPYQVSGHPALVEGLRNGPRLLVIDEAQQLNSNCIEYLRYLHDHQRTNFGLLLVGGDGCWEVLSREPMLRSRVHRRVAFRPMTGQEVLEVLPRWHRLYRDQDPELLGFIDDVFGHGLFRNWVHFTKSFQQVFPQARLDQDKTRAVFALFGGVGVH